MILVFVLEVVLATIRNKLTMEKYGKLLYNLIFQHINLAMLLLSYFDVKVTIKSAKIQCLVRILTSMT